MDPYLFPRQIVGRQQTSNKPDVDFEHGNFSVLQEPKQRNKRQTRTVAGFTGFNARESDERNAPSLKSHRSFGAGLDRRWRVALLGSSSFSTALRRRRATRSSLLSCRQFTFCLKMSSVSVHLHVLLFMRRSANCCKIN